MADLYGGVQILGSGGGENNFDTSSGMNQEPVKKENLDQTVDDDDYEVTTRTAEQARG